MLVRVARARDRLCGTAGWVTTVRARAYVYVQCR